MPYQANRDATIPKVIGTTKNAEGERVAHYESVNYGGGAVIFEEDIAPHILRRLEEGDDHLSSLLKYIDEAEARQILGQHVQDTASQPVAEDEILHQEERLGSEASPAPSPAVGPGFETGDVPPYEAPPTGDGQESAGSDEDQSEVSTEDQTVGQGTGPDSGETVAEEDAEAVSDDDSKPEEEPSADESQEAAPETTEENEGVAEGDTSDEAQQDGQDASDDSQEKSDESSETAADAPAGDKFTDMSKTALLAEAKDRKISGRTKMTEDQLRDALRAE